MNWKIWFIAALFLAACVGFSFQDELEESEDVPMENEAQELDEEAETDLEDRAGKVRRPFCPKFSRRKCFYIKNCYKRRLFCFCVKRYYGDESEYDNQVNDKVAEDEAEELKETDVPMEDEEVEDPSKVKRPRRCSSYRRRKCYIVKVGYKKRRFCFCVRKCYGDETLNDNQLSDEIPEDEADELQEDAEEEQENTDMEDPAKKGKKGKKGRGRVCPKNRRRKCYYYKSCGNKRRRACGCVKRRYGDETEYDNQLNDEFAEDEAEELEETSDFEDPSKGRRRRCSKSGSRRKCFVTKRSYKKRRFCFCTRPCYGDEVTNDN